MKIFTGGGLIGWLAKAREEKLWMNIERLVHVNGLTVLIDLEALVLGRMVGNVSSVEKD